MCNLFQRASSMPRLYAFTLLLIIFATAPSGLWAADSKEPAPVGTLLPNVDLAVSSPVAFTISKNLSAVILDVQIGGLSQEPTQSGISWRIENEGVIGIDGMPDLPAISRWVRVPIRGVIDLEVTVGNETRQAGESPADFIGGDEGAEGLNDPERLNGIWPAAAAIISEPMIWRGVRMVNLVIYPVRWDSDSQEYLLSENIRTEIVNRGGRGSNEVLPGRRERCRDFDLTLRGLLLNPPSRDDADEVYSPGSYLIVANDNYPAAVDEFVEWKRRTGHPVEVLTFDPAAVGRAALKDLIRERYEETYFSFLVLIGNEEVNAPLRIPYDNEFYDNFFGQLEGDDPLADVAVGTYNCLNVANLTCAIRRTISYESDPADGDWCTRGFVGVGHCSVPDDLSPSYSGKWVQAALERKGFEITSTYFADNGDNDFSPNVAQQYNAGVNLIIVRGHQSDLREQDIRAGTVYPFHFMVSSSTISQGGGGSFNRIFRIGTPDDMRGPSCGFGHNPSPRTNIANAIVGGLAEALLHRDIRSFGWARNYLTAKIPIVMPADQGQAVTRYWGTLRYYGDPGQEPWLETPQAHNVEFSEFLEGQNALAVEVLSGEEGVEGAHVTLYDPDGLQLTSFTDSEGVAYFAWENPEGGGYNPVLTVTGKGIRPHLEDIEIGAAEALTVTDIEVIDVEHNDGILSPGDRIEIVATIQNRSNEVSDAREIEWTHRSSYLSESLEPVQLRALNPGESAEVRFERQDQLEPMIRLNTPDGTIIPSFILLPNSCGVPIRVSAADFVSVDAEIEMGESIPGSELQLRFTIRNTGSADANEVGGNLEAMSDYASVVEGGVIWGAIASGEAREAEGSTIIRIAENAIPGSTVEFKLTVGSDVGAGYEILWNLPLDARAESDPVGPDKYGYIALENGDDDNEWAEAPEYNWVNISPWGGDVQGQLLNFPVVGELDVSQVIELPFTFGYYGQDFREITVCSNGWIAMGDQTPLLVNQQNWPLPGYDGAWGMIAPFWDRLEMTTRSDGIFGYHDPNAGTYTIQWQTGVQDNGGEWHPNAFQVILMDRERHPTPTGDSEFMFKYETVNDVQNGFEMNAGCTVGISSPNGTDGITYSYWHLIAEGGRALAARRAILWTTALWGEQTVLEGRVTRYIDSTAVVGATIRTSGGFSRLSVADGEYQIIGEAAGEVTVTASGEGYGEVSVEGVELVEGEAVVRDFVLPHGWVSIETDTVYLTNGIPRDDWADGGIPLINIGNLPVDITLDTLVLDSTLLPYFREISFENMVGLNPEERYRSSISIWADTSGEFSGMLYLSTSTPQETLTCPVRIELNVGTNDKEEFPRIYSLGRPYPNPFNSRTSLKFSLPVAGRVGLSLTDISGREVRNLADGEFKAGSHRLTLEAGDLPTGLYFIRMEAGEFRASQRVLLIR